MNFRKLIEQAMNEAREEFAEIVSRKLAALMGDDAVTAPGRRPAEKAPIHPRRGRPPGAPQKRGGRSRAPADHMAQLREKVIGALRTADSMKKAQIMKIAKLPGGEIGRVGNVLKRLKDEGVVSMKGQKGAAIYTLKPRWQEAAAAADTAQS